MLQTARMKLCGSAFIVAVAVALAAKPGYGFTCPRGEVKTGRNVDTALSSEPQVFAEHMAKALADQLKAIKDVEEKKETEIEVRANGTPLSIKEKNEQISPCEGSTNGHILGTEEASRRIEESFSCSSDPRCRH
jgi:hypothetical protein